MHLLCHPCNTLWRDGVRLPNRMARFLHPVFEVIFLSRKYLDGQLRHAIIQDGLPARTRSIRASGHEILRKVMHFFCENYKSGCVLNDLGCRKNIQPFTPTAAR